MVFSSAVFLFAFFPLYILVVSFVRNIKASNILLLIMSLVFYAWGEPVYIFLMFFSMLVNYLLALPAGQYVGKDCIAHRVLFSSDIVFNIIMLVLFKYAGFLVSTVNALMGITLPIPQIPLPIGISFFTFQTMSYVIDAYKGNCSVQKNFAKFMLYVSFFPQLIAGPIVKYRDIEQQLTARKTNITAISNGIRRFIIGLSKKMLIANACAEIVDGIYAGDGSDLNIIVAWVAAVGYCFQIYFDFSGYSDMAIGLGKMAGFHFMENFNYPYIAASMRDFWKRWHISLTTWFREYVYFPLGGNRGGAARTGFNRMFVFVLTGIWHGALWTFVVWGIFHGVFQLLETYLIHPEKWKHRACRHLYAMAVVAVGFTIFRAETMAQAGQFVLAMFAGFRFTAGGLVMLQGLVTPYHLLLLAAATIGATPLVRNQADEFARRYDAKKALTCCKYAVSVVLMLLCMMSIASSTYNPFIYFRF